MTTTKLPSTGSSFVDRVVRHIQNIQISTDSGKVEPLDHKTVGSEEVTTLLLQHREFSRQKRQLLRKAVESALSHIKKHAPKEEVALFSSECSSDEEEDPAIMMEWQDTNAMNQVLLKAYKKNVPTETCANEALEVESTVLVTPPLSVTPVTAVQEEEPISVIKKRSQKESALKRSRARLLRPSDHHNNSDSTSSSKPSLAERPTLRYADLGGIETCLQDIRELIEQPLLHPEIYIHLGVEPPRGILLHGAPGCGKTSLAMAMAGELGVPFLKISAPEIVSGMSGESEAKLRELFDEARQNAPCLVFIDEIDAITPKRENAQREMERRIVAQLLTCMDDLSWEQTDYKPVIVIGATNRPDALDAALRRAGRFDREIRMGAPDEAARERILRVLANKLKLDGDVDFQELARKTPGYVGADLKALTREAAVSAVSRIFNSLPELMSLTENKILKDVQTRTQVSDQLRAATLPLSQEQLAPLAIRVADFEVALKKVQPSAKREGFAVVPNVTWADVGALQSAREELRLSIVEPIRRAAQFAQVGIHAPAGLLLWGPPGCGKTLLARAIANESHSNFISVKGPELLNKYVGESERAVRQVFERAKSSAPCVIFFDELDALCPRRSSDESSAHSSRVVNQLLTEMDGMEGRRQVFVMAATNRPDMIDPAMMRPGRLDKLLFINVPNASDRLDILKTLTRDTPLAACVNLSDIAHDSRCEGLTGADLAALVREAALEALRYLLKEDCVMNSNEKVWVTQEHFNLAFDKVRPSVSESDRRAYQQLQLHWR